MNTSTRLKTLEKARDVGNNMLQHMLVGPRTDNQIVDTLREFETAKSLFYTLDKYLKEARLVIRDWPASIYMHEDGGKAALTFQITSRRNITASGKEFCYNNGMFTTDDVTNIKVVIVESAG